MHDAVSAIRGIIVRFATLFPFRINALTCRNPLRTRRRKDLCQTPPIPSDGEGVGSVLSMAAGCGRAMKPGGRTLRGTSRRSMDGLCLLAARLEGGLLTAPCAPSCSPHAVGRKAAGVIRQRSP